MDYFLLKQDLRYTDVPVLQKVTEKIDPWKLQDLQPDDLVEKALMLHVMSGPDSRFLDFMEGPFPLVSDAFMKLLKAYCADIPFKLTVLANVKHRQMKNYHIPFVESIEALHPASEWNQDRSVLKNMILLQEIIRNKKVFRIQEGRKWRIIVRLDVAESILRRDFLGIRMEKVQLE